MLVVAITILTTLTLTTTIAAVYAGEGDDDGDGNKQKAEDDSAAAIADCDDNEVERAGFDCIAIAANDVEIEPPEEETATLPVCKGILPGSDLEPEDFDFTVTDSNGETFTFVGVPPPTCQDVPVTPGEYDVVEEAAQINFATRIQDGSDCVQDPADARRATGVIQSGETQECRFINALAP
jgi:hypothetical protein